MRTREDHVGGRDVSVADDAAYASAVREAT
jgi:hypothetical protein